MSSAALLSDRFSAAARGGAPRDTPLIKACTESGGTGSDLNRASGLRDSSRFRFCEPCVTSKHITVMSADFAFLCFCGKTYVDTEIQSFHVDIL